MKAVTEMIHQLQRERGMSNVFLCSRGERFATQRAQQETASEKSEKTLRSLLNALYLSNSDNGLTMRLVTTITFALQGMDNLKDLRSKVALQQLTSTESTNAFCRLIAALIDVIFEAADVASDPAITALLVALFNFIQGKEFAGQERACGAIGFSSQHFQSSLCDRITALTDSQDNAFDTFTKFADATELSMWQQQLDSEHTRHLKRLRKMICALDDSDSCTASLSEIWYDIATLRIDDMRDIEEHITDRLIERAAQRISEAEEELRNNEQLVASLNSTPPVEGAPISMIFDETVKGLSIGDDDTIEGLPPSSLSAHKSFYDLIREQAQRIHDITSELNGAKQALNEQRVIDRAKLLLMQHSKLSENQAYKKLQSAAMDNNIRIAELAHRIVANAS
ncbi:nitrate- and nitrite sensing domain-containing protein [Alteromonas sp. A079]|uniref:nitrate- and nitrite sensing domain-containing protein n=1 Tax=Alteromonas sp. A079 TaxID=3410268 RepID=UPI003B9FF20E